MKFDRGSENKLSKIEKKVNRMTNKVYPSEERRQIERKTIAEKTTYDFPVMCSCNISNVLMPTGSSAEPE